MNLPKIYVHIAPDGRLLQARVEPPISWTTIGGNIYEYVPYEAQDTRLDECLKTLWVKLCASKGTLQELTTGMLVNMQTAFYEVIQEALRVERERCQDPASMPAKALLEWILTQLILEPTTLEDLAERWFRWHYVNVEVPYTDNEEVYWAAWEKKLLEMETQRTSREIEVREALSVLRHVTKAKALGPKYARVVTQGVIQKILAAAHELNNWPTF